MLILERGQQAQFKFIFMSNGAIYDPTASGRDLMFTVIRGDNSTGPVIDGPFSFVQQNPNVRIPGGSTNYVTTPDHSSLDITGDIELVARVKLDNYASGTTQLLIAKRANLQYSFMFFVTTTGQVSLAVSTTGSNVLQSISNVAPFVNGVAYWIKGVRNATTGVSSFYYAADQSTEPTSWTQIATSFSAASGNIWSSTASLDIGGNGIATSATTGNIYRALVRNGIGGNTVADFNATFFNYGATSYTDPYGRVWTFNGSVTFNSSSGTGNGFVVRTNKYEFTVYYTVPSSLFEGTYTVLAQTTDDFGTLTIASLFQIQGQAVTLSPLIAQADKTAVINYKPMHQDLAQGNTSTVLLIGHADGLQLNSPVRIRSVQSAVDLLNSDFDSPLLRAVFDAYSCGARDIIICAAAPMSEYIDRTDDRTLSTTLWDLSAATPTSTTFYQKYYSRLAATYSAISDLDWVDYIVPLETSIINTGGVDFVTQLANYLNDFHNNTGYVQLGVIGSRSNGISSSDIATLKSTSVFTNKFTTYNSNGTIATDKGRFVIPVYGEAVFQHQQLKKSYVSNMAAAVAGMMSIAPLNVGLIRARIPGATSVFGSDLSQQEMSDLESIGVNTIYRGRKTRRSIPFEVYLSNDYTMAHPLSTLSKSPQMRLVALLVSEIRGYGYAAIGKFGYDNIISQVRNLLEGLRQRGIILEFSYNVETRDIGELVFYIEILSALGLKKVNFAVSSGPGA